MLLGSLYLHSQVDMYELMLQNKKIEFNCLHSHVLDYSVELIYTLAQTSEIILK